MVRHVILWQLKQEYTPAQKAAAAAGIRTALEGLAGRIPGLVSIRVYTGALPSSSGADVMLDAAFTDEAALAGYAVHPLHQAAANGYVRPHTERRTCLDFTV